MSLAYENETRENAREPASPAQSSPDAARMRTVIQSGRIWQLINMGELWKFRELLFFLAWRDVKVRYKQTVLGAAWAVLQPALMMIVFTLFLGRAGDLTTVDFPYPLFVYAGLLPWSFFATGITSAGNSVIGSERLITKIYFPRLAIPFASVGAAVVDFFIALGLLIILMLYYGVTPGIGLMVVPLLLMILGLAAIGIGTLLAALNVYYRDFRHVIPYLVQLGMFATPAIYMQPRGGQDRLVQSLLILNPINALVTGFRDAIMDKPLAWDQIGLAALIVFATFLLGCLYFRRVEDQFADFI